MPVTSALSFEDTNELSHPPVPGGQVLAVPGFSIEHPPGIAHHQEADPIFPGEVDDRPGRLVTDLGQSSAVATFEDPRPGLVLLPPARSPLAFGWSPSGHGPTPGLRFGQMEPRLGPQGPSRREQRTLARHHGQGMDDAQVHPGDAVWVESFSRPIGLDLDFGGDVDAEPGPVGQQGHRPDPPPLGNLTSETDLEGSHTPGHRDLLRASLQAEGHSSW